MSEFEICQQYLQAKIKSKQIEILADMNICKKQDIVEPLTRCGIELQGYRNKSSSEELKCGS